jgi:anaerobic dimethyl sulfoxide reductase subunit A
VLPACTQFETWGVEDGWKFGEEVFLTPKIVDPPFETKSDYRICADLSRKFGVWEQFTAGGKDEKAWAEWIIDEIYRKTRFPEMPAFSELEKSNAGVYVKPVKDPVIAFSDFRKNPEKYPLKTPTGRIELFSKPLFDMNRPDEIPAVPKYVQEWESPFGKEAGKYPLQAIGHHYMPRVHSTHFNNEWTTEAFPQLVFMNKADADARKIRNGDFVKVWNDRGALVAKCRITSGIMPGVIDIPQGAWYKPGKDGIDTGGNINMLTTERWTALAKGNPQHTIMVQVEKYNN